MFRQGALTLRRRATGRASRTILSHLANDVMVKRVTLREGTPMANAERQMPEHVGAAYRDAVDNIIFLKRQQWVAPNYALNRICGYFRNLCSLL